MFAKKVSKRDCHHQNESFDTIVMAAETANRANDSLQSLVILDGSFSQIRPIVNIDEAAPSTSKPPTKKRRALSPVVASSMQLKKSCKEKLRFQPLMTSTPRPSTDDLLEEKIANSVNQMRQDGSVWFRQFKDIFLHSSIQLQGSLKHYKDQFQQQLDEIELRQERLDRQRRVVMAKIKEVDQTMKQYGDFLENFPEKMEFCKSKIYFLLTRHFLMKAIMCVLFICIYS